MSYFGIDVSQHNGIIDWVKASKKVKFAIIRLGWIGNKNNHTIDAKFEINYKNAKAAGVKVGVYIYNYCNNETTAKDGADWVINKLKNKKIDLPVYIDMEDSSIASLGKTKLTNIVKAFNERIEAAGYWAGVYANKNWFDNYLIDGLEKTYTSWIAHYTSGTDKYKGSYDMWQNSSTGKIDGIKGNVDTNYLYRDLFSAIDGDSSSTSSNNYGSSTSTTSIYYKKFDSTSIVDGLKSIGVDSSMTNRKKIAAANGIKNYEGTSSQNIKLLELAKKGKLKKAGSSSSPSSSSISYYKKFNSTSIVDGLKSIGVDSSMASRKKIAKANGILNYEGTPSQNIKLLELAKKGKLKKA